MNIQHNITQIEERHCAKEFQSLKTAFILLPAATLRQSSVTIPPLKKKKMFRPAVKKMNLKGRLIQCPLP